jgi:hypothetical protein
MVQSVDNRVEVNPGNNGRSTNSQSHVESPGSNGNGHINFDFLKRELDSSLYIHGREITHARVMRIVEELGYDSGSSMNNKIARDVMLKLGYSEVARGKKKPVYVTDRFG